LISLELPADPRWLQTARAVAIHAVSDLDLDTDQLDDLVLLIAETMTGLLELHGGQRLLFELDPVDGHLNVRIAGYNSDHPMSESAWNGSLSGLITGALAKDVRFESSNGDITISFTFPKAMP
jgi:hypothetical protein